jgi:hypothetical protein
LTKESNTELDLALLLLEEDSFTPLLDYTIQSTLLKSEGGTPTL